MNAPQFSSRFAPIALAAFAVGGAFLHATICASRAQIPIAGSTVYTQDFDSLEAEPVSWLDNITVPGWFAGINANNTPDGTLSPSDGAEGEGLSGLLNLGSVDDEDRALGSKATGTGNFANIAFGVLFRNTSSLPLEVTNITYTGELWRTAASEEVPRPEQWFTYFKTSPSLFTNVEPGLNSPTPLPGSFTALPALNWNSPTNTPPASPLDGNAPANRTTLIADPNIVVNPGAYLMIRWVDPNLGGTDGFQGIDDVSVRFATIIPEPAGALLGVLGGVGLLGRRARKS